jgi:hypothetical protein
MALDKWAIQRIVLEETARALDNTNLDEKIQAYVSQQLDTVVNVEIDAKLEDFKKSIKIMNEQISILKDAIDKLNKRINK